MKFGILTSGGDCPGLNAAIRGVVKSAFSQGATTAIGISDGYRGLIENRTRVLDQADVTGILTLGGTILGSSREKPFAGRDDGNLTDAQEGMDKPELIKATYRKLGLDCLVVLGGNGTQTTAFRLQQEGLAVIGLPKTIDNDLYGTDPSFGFHSALSIATEGVDRLHTTASSHNRVMIIELMGHKAGWLALNAGIAGGGDVILIPEIPYDADHVARHILDRASSGRPFSIVVVAEGAISRDEALLDKKERKRLRAAASFPSIGYRVADEIASRTGMETRVTVLGYLQRGGIPSAYDRVLATSFGSAAAELMSNGAFGRMVCMRSGMVSSLPLSAIAGKTRKVPAEHELVKTARSVGTCFGAR